MCIRDSGAIVDQMYASLIASLVEGRGLTREAAIATIDKAMYFGEAAVAAKLVDVVTPWESFRDEATGGAAWSRMKLKETAAAGVFDIARLQVFLGLLPTNRPSEPHVALVYAPANIIDGNVGGPVAARGVRAQALLQCVEVAPEVVREVQDVGEQREGLRLVDPGRDHDDRAAGLSQGPDELGDAAGPQRVPGHRPSSIWRKLA